MVLRVPPPNNPLLDRSQSENDRDTITTRGNSNGGGERGGESSREGDSSDHTTCFNALLSQSAKEKHSPPDELSTRQIQDHHNSHSNSSKDTHTATATVTGFSTTTSTSSSCPIPCLRSCGGVCGGMFSSRGCKCCPSCSCPRLTTIKATISAILTLASAGHTLLIHPLIIHPSTSHNTPSHNTNTPLNLS